MENTNKKTFFKMPKRVSRKWYTFDWKMWMRKEIAEISTIEANRILYRLYKYWI